MSESDPLSSHGEVKNEPAESHFQNVTKPEDTLARYVRPKTEENTPKPPQPEKRKLTRRRLLLLTAAAMVGAAAASNMFGGNSEETAEPELPAKPDFEVETDPQLLEFINEARLQPEIIPEMLKVYNQPESSYGIFTASAVTLATRLEQGEEADLFGLGSGSVTEYRGELYVATAFHVVRSAILNPEQILAIAIPGIETPLRCNTRDLYTFGRIANISEDPDLALFFKLDEKTAQIVKELQNESKLTPLKPFPVLDAITQDPIVDKLALFRFQYSSVGIAYTNPTYYSRDKGRPYGKLYALGNEAVTCGGVSGSPLLRSEDGQVLPEFGGVLQFGVYRDHAPAQEDVMGVFGQNCSQELAFVPFSQYSMTEKLHREGDPY